MPITRSIRRRLGQRRIDSSGPPEARWRPNDLLGPTGTRACVRSGTSGPGWWNRPDRRDAPSGTPAVPTDSQPASRLVQARTPARLRTGPPGRAALPSCRSGPVAEAEKLSGPAQILRQRPAEFGILDQGRIDLVLLGNSDHLAPQLRAFPTTADHIEQVVVLALRAPDRADRPVRGFCQSRSGVPEATTRSKPTGLRS